MPCHEYRCRSYTQSRVFRLSLQSWLTGSSLMSNILPRRTSHSSLSPSESSWHALQVSEANSSDYYTLSEARSSLSLKTLSRNRFSMTRPKPKQMDCPNEIESPTSLTSCATPPGSLCSSRYQSGSGPKASASLQTSSKTLRSTFRKDQAPWTTAD